LSNDILLQIRSRYNTLTKAEKKVADYILADPRSMLYLSITDLAEACGVGDTSVFRFCRDLDLKGYQAFKMAVAQSVSADDEAPKTPGNDTEADSLTDMIRKMLNTCVGALKETSDLISGQQIAEAVRWMADAAHIHFYGVGASMITALDGYHKFMRILPKASMTIDSHLQAMSAALLTEKDLAIIVSYSGSTKDTVEIARIAKSRGARVICITRFIKSPLTSFSDLTLLCGANEGPYQGGSMSARIAQMFLLDVLYMAYYRQTHEQSKANRALTTDSITDKLF
jgi:DNA-binding MurR/RpiR family transcriptional regulator